MSFAFRCVAIAGFIAGALFAPALHAQVGRSPEITMDVGDEPGVVPDEDYELPPEYARKVVFFRTHEPAGTIIIETSERTLYLVMKDNLAMRYGIGVGRDGFRWKGQLRVSRKAEWPDWIPPAEMIERQPYLPRFMAGGPGNPRSAHALSISAAPCIASTAPISRRRSARRCHPAASVS